LAFRSWVEKAQMLRRNFFLFLQGDSMRRPFEKLGGKKQFIEQLNQKKGQVLLTWKMMSIFAHSSCA
jgi:hypothetical protein